MPRSNQSPGVPTRRSQCSSKSGMATKSPAVRPAVKAETRSIESSSRRSMRSPTGSCPAEGRRDPVGHRFDARSPVANQLGRVSQFGEAALVSGIRLREQGNPSPFPHVVAIRVAEQAGAHERRKRLPRVQSFHDRREAAAVRARRQSTACRRRAECPRRSGRNVRAKSTSHERRAAPGVESGGRQSAVPLPPTRGE